MFDYVQQLFTDPLSFLVMLCYRAPAILIALTFHEFSHGYMAYRLGDPTAKYMGRLTLNPLKHLDPLGTFMLFFLGFGWAKPVPVNPNNLRNPRRDDFWVSFAGPLSNLILCFFSVGFYLLLLSHFNDFFGTYESLKGIGYQVYTVALNVLSMFYSINVALFVFNLLPVPPLDGYHIANDIFFKRELFASPQVANAASMVLMLLAFSGYLGKGLSYVTGWVINGIVSFYSLFIYI